MFIRVAPHGYQVTKPVILGGNRTTRPRLVPRAVFHRSEQDGGTLARHALPNSVLYGSQ
jgi:hypothetical protein